MDRLRALILLGLLTVPAFAAEEPLIEAAKAAVANKLFDPESARFREVKIVAGKVCGEVNAKNRSGGYDGFRKFFYAIPEKLALIPESTRITSDFYSSMSQSADRFCP